MAHLLKFANGDAPSIEAEAKFTLDPQTGKAKFSAQAPPAVAGAHSSKVKWEGNVKSGSTSSNNSEQVISGAYRVILPDGTFVPIAGVVTLSRSQHQSTHKTAATFETLSLSQEQFQATLTAGDADFRNKKAKQIQKTREQYGTVNTTSAAKPQRVGDADVKQQMQDKRRKREDETRSQIENTGSASKKSKHQNQNQNQNQQQQQPEKQEPEQQLPVPHNEAAAKKEKKSKKDKR